ncbi:MAG: class I SAM-dependent methyltransferase [Ignavibacteriales bacterium]|nr:class I SAM-dependent methyltransferase [Ignavibacteriales bacterium]
MDEKILRHRQVWQSKKILRDIYLQWYKWIENDLSAIEGKTLEIGSGIGNYKEFKPDILSSDIHVNPWVDLTFDAHRLPFNSSTFSNIVLVDTIHHLYNPIMFLEEALRVLKAGGRLILIEPFPSPFSLLIYRRFHPEPFIMDIDYYEVKNLESKKTWDANQAIPYLLFFKNKNRFQTKFLNRLKFIKRKKISFVLYPATGGFENKQIILNKLVPIIKFIENILTPFNWLMAFRCYIVIEKI